MKAATAMESLARPSLYSFRQIYIIRHGATKFNAEGGGVDRIRGWRNIPLSDTGREQVKKLAASLKNSGIGFMVASDLERTRETAERVQETTGAHLVLSPKFRPWDLGEYTGQESMAVHPMMAKYAYEKPDRAIPGGESFNGFKDRVFWGLREFMGQFPERTLAIVTHHRVERLIHAWIDRGSPRNMDVNLNVMFQRGEGTAHYDKIRIDLNTLYGLVDHK